jgi:hypothetical protein
MESGSFMNTDYTSMTAIERFHERKFGSKSAWSARKRAKLKVRLTGVQEAKKPSEGRY